jgi:formate dehydrogenase iron-sulfur subunit
VYVPRDTTACAVGADGVAAAIESLAAERGVDLELVRNGSRGLFWLEPLVEVDLHDHRIGFGPVEPADVGNLLDCLRDEPAAHPRHLGSIHEVAYLKNQQRLTFMRAGEGDPLSLDNYVQLGGFAGLRNAMRLAPSEIVAAISASGLRGRGGAAFPTGTKWQTVLDTPSLQKYVVCNADEGDSGTFADRLLMESDPYQLIEGMTIAGLAVGATRGFVYLRSEYPRAHSVLTAAIARAEDAGYLGHQICGSDQTFHLEVRLGAGAYICGEETSLLNSLEGKRGTVRVKPPLPAIQGLFGQPTLVNNVLTLAAATTVLASGAAAYRNFGTGQSRGTLTVQLAGNVRRGGLFELAFGATVREVVEGFGGGTASGRPVRAIQVGGPLGAYLPERQWDTPLDYEALAEIDAMLGHGGIVVFDDTVDMSEQARFAMQFCAHESCGKCTPCRIGSVRGVEVIDRIREGQESESNLIVLRDLCDTMELGSLCAMGGMTPYPVRSALKHFAVDFER